MDPKLRNWTFHVSTDFPCDEITQSMEEFRPDPVWRVTALGCKLLQLLQEMHHFQMSYVPEIEQEWMMNSTNVDIYARATALTPSLLDYAYPIQAIIDRRYGFLLRNVQQAVTARSYYSLPFSKQSWFNLLLMVCIIAPILYLLCKWEKRVVGGRQEYSLAYELMTIIGVCCQHIPPIKVVLLSRRIAYLVFFMFSWLVYTYYSSNLLSHLVNDREETITAQQLARSDYQFLRLNSLLLNTQGLPWYASRYKRSFRDYALMKRKYQTSEQVDIAHGLTQVGTKKAALFSDFITIYPYIRKYLDNEAICELKEINLLTGLKEYVYTSKHFPLKEQFRIGMLKIKEVGLLKHLKQGQTYSAPKCQKETRKSYACFDQILGPLIVLGSAFLASIIFLFLERAYYFHERNQVLPFVN